MNIKTLRRTALLPMLFTLPFTIAMADTLNQPNLLWHNSSTGAIKFMPVNSMIPDIPLPVVGSSNTNLIPKGIGDFTGDGKFDILFHNQNSGNLRIWEMDGTTKVENIQVLGSSNINLQIAGVGDFDGDGDNDIATFNTNSGSLRMWVMEGTTRVANELVLSGANVNLVPRGAGDMNNDGIPDIVLRNNNSGAVRVWTMNDDLTRKGNEYVTGSSNTNLELRGVVDINGDGNNDILNYNTNTGKLRAWLMDGNLKITENAEIAQDVDPEWSVRGGYYVQSPAVDLSGTEWSVFEEVLTNTCPADPDSQAYEMTIVSYSDGALAVDIESVGTFDGIYSGNNIAYGGSYTRDEGTATADVKLTANSDYTKLTGGSMYTLKGEYYGIPIDCGGTTRVIATQK